MAKDFRRSTRRVVATVLSTPWMIERGTLDQIRTLLEDRSNGRLRSRDEISELIGRPAGSQSGVIKAASLSFDPEEADEGPYVVDGVAVLPLFGVLAPRLSWMDELSGGTSTELFQGWFAEALSDSRVSSILIHVDSPGGSAQGNEEVAQAIRAGRGIKPINAVATGMMASAAYYVGSSASKVFASYSTEVGSVGAYMIHGETSKQDAAEGVKYTVIKAGENKAAGNSVEPLTDKTKAILQERIDAFYAQFVSAVASNRGVSVETVEANYGQGKVLIAGASKAAGLIDDVGTFAEVLDSMRVKQKPPAGRGVGSAKTVEPVENVPQAQTTETVGVPATGGNPQQPLMANEDGRTPELQHGGATTMNKVLAALVKLGMCQADANEATVNAAVAGFCAAKGVAVPKSEDEIVKLLDPPKQSVDVNAIRAAERDRISQLETRGALLKIGTDSIRAAIDEGLDVPSALNRWTDELAAKQKAVNKNIVPGDQEDDVFQKSVVDGLFHRACPDAKAPEGGLNQAAREAGRMTLLDIGKRFLAKDQSSSRVDMYDQDEVAKAMLMGDNPSRHMVAPRGGIYANTSGVGYNRPGDFPGVLSALMGKMLDDAETLVDSTYQGWTAQIESVNDFKPKTIHAVGEFGELPEHEDATLFDESLNAEEAAWIQAAEYGDNWTLTPRMVINDDLGALQDVSLAKQSAHDLTLERLCVNLLTGNAPAQDSVQLFDYATRVVVVNGQNVNINDVQSGSGGPPGTTQLALMRKLARKIYGLNLKQKLNQTVKTILIPEDLETATESVLLVGTGAGTGTGNGVVVPTSEANTQLFRGRVQYIVVPLLAEYSALQWYALTSNPRTAIVTTRMKGFEKMKATSWFDPATGCRVWNFLGRMAAAIRTWRTILRNAGA